MSLNLSTFKPYVSSDQSRANLGASSNLRLNTFKAMGNNWTPAPDTSDNTTGGIIKNTITGLPQAAVETLVTPAVKFLGSAVRAPGDIINAIQGKPIDTGSPMLDPATGKPMQTIQGEAVSSIDDPNATALGATVKAVGDTVGGAGDVLGASELASSNVLEKGVNLVKKGASALSDTAASFNEKQALKDALDITSPKLSAKDTAQALAEGRGQGGGLLSKTKIAPSTRDLDVANAVKGFVQKGASGAENINNIQKALSSEAENLKSQIASVDHPYSFKELNAKLNNIESPISIKGTAFEKQIGAVKKAAMNIAQEKGGTISDLLDARKDFDALVSKEYPNLYDKENAPMRNAITSIRNTMNDFIESNLPDNVSFKDSLKKQSLYYDAIDNIAEKSVGETKTTGLQRVTNTIKKHPLGAAATGILTGEAIRKGLTGSF